MSDTQVIDFPDRRRYVLERDGQELGYAAYRREDGVITFTHTQIDESLQEKGLGSALAAGALDAVRTASEDRIVAECPFIAAYVERHPDYADLLSR